MLIIKNLSKFNKILEIRRKSLLKILLYFFILTVLLMACSLSITSYSNYIMLKEARESNRNYLRTVSMTIDNIMYKIRDKGLSFLADRNIDKMLTISDKLNPDFSWYSDEIYQLLSKLYVYEDIVDDAFIYFQKADFLLSSTGSYDKKFYMEKQMIYQDYPLPYWDRGNKSHDNVVVLPATQTHRFNINGQKQKYKTIIPLVLSMDKVFSPNSFMVVNIDEQMIYQMINGMNITKKGEIFLVDREDHKVISTTERDMIGSNFDMMLLQSIGEEELGQSEIFKDGVDYILTYKPSSWKGLYYVILTPKKVLTGPINQFLFRTLIAILAFTFLGVLVSAYFTLRIYSPLADMVNYIKKLARSSDDKAKNEYDFIKSGIHSLQQIQQENMSSLMQFMLYRAVHHHLTAADVEHLHRNYGLLANSKYFAVAVVRIGYLLSFYQSSAEEQSDLRKRFKTLLSADYEAVEVSKNEFLLLLGSEEQAASSDLIVNLLQELYSFNQNHNNMINIVIGLSKLFEHLTETRTYYEQACLAIEQRNVNHRDILCQEKEWGYDKRRHIISSDIKELIHKYLEKGNRQSVLELLHNLFDQFKKSKSTFAHFKQAIHELFFCLLEFIYTRNLNSREIFQVADLDVFTMVDSIHSPEALEQFCTEIMAKTAEFMVEKQDSVQLIDAMIEYIHEHTAEVNLTELADKFKMNTNYISQYFHKNKGVTFTDYLNRHKINKAKELMLNTNYTGNEICKIIGFNNANAFIRMFKKLEGITPSEFRKDQTIDKNKQTVTKTEFF